MLRKVDRIIVRVPSLEAAVPYYRDVLGLKLLKQDARLASFRLADAGPGADAAELVLHVDPDLPAEAVYYLVDDVRDLYKRRKELRLTFVGSPQPAARGYRATVKDPFGTVLLLLDRQAGTAAIEDAKAPGSLFAGVEHRSAPKRERLAQIYVQIARTADDLPYTPHFETLYKSYVDGTDPPPPTRQEVWRHLLNMRKGGKLPKLGEAKSRPPAVSHEERAQLLALLGEDVGKRDRLPYTKRFDELVDQFNRTQPRPLSPHLVWRLVATLAK